MLDSEGWAGIGPLPSRAVSLAQVIAWEDELRADRPVPFGHPDQSGHGFLVYVGNLDEAEVMRDDEARSSESSASPFLNAAGPFCARSASPGSGRNRRGRVRSLQSFGVATGGERGMRDPPPQHLPDLCVSTFAVLGCPRVSGTMLGIRRGRRARVQARDRSTLVVFAFSWSTLGNGKGRRPVPAQIAVELLMAVAMTTLCFTDTRKGGSPRVTCADASGH